MLQQRDLAAVFTDTDDDAGFAPPTDGAIAGEATLIAELALTFDLDTLVAEARRDPFQG